MSSFAGGCCGSVYPTPFGGRKPYDADLGLRCWTEQSIIPFNARGKSADFFRRNNEIMGNAYLLLRRLIRERHLLSRNRISLRRKGVFSASSSARLPVCPSLARPRVCFGAEHRCLLPDVFGQSPSTSDASCEPLLTTSPVGADEVQGSGRSLPRVTPYSVHGSDEWRVSPMPTWKVGSALCLKPA